MNILTVSYNPLYVRLGLISLAAALLLGYIVLLFRRRRQAGIESPASERKRPAPSAHLFEFTYRPGSSLVATVMRAALILLAIWVAGGLFMVTMPQGTLDRMAQALRLRNPTPPVQENISLLYLGDEIKGKEFHIRGAIRNISTLPLEKLDAMIRLYAPDGSLIETSVVRMDAERIAPDAISAFHLTYPDFAGQFASYAVEFKLRDGQALPYKDMRGAHTGS